PLQSVFRVSRTLHRLEHRRAGVLERNIQVRQDVAGGHHRNDLVHVRIGIDVVQAHPGTQLPERLTQLQHAGFHWHTLPEAGLVLAIHTVGAGVLADHQQLLYTRLHQPFRLIEHVAHRPGIELATHAWDNAEAALVV